MKNVSECPFFFLVDAKNFPENEGIVFVSDKKNFTKMSVGDTYDRYGQAVDTDESGEYEVTAYNYHDGHNWQSIIIDSIVDEDIDFTPITDTDEISRMWAAIESMEFQKEDKGIRYYQTADFDISKSAWAGNWATYEINEK